MSERIYYIQKNYTDVLENYKESFSFTKEYFTLNAMVQDVLCIYSKMVKGD